jgi:hypothetical protein
MNITRNSKIRNQRGTAKSGASVALTILFFAARYRFLIVITSNMHMNVKEMHMSEFGAVIMGSQIKARQKVFNCRKPEY